MPHAPTPPLILVCGMHRSGTSLLSSLLDGLGIGLPGPLVEADQHNPGGYFEHQEICALQEALLVELGRWWPSQAGCLSLPRDWRTAVCTQTMRERLRHILANNMEKQTGPWAIKDPRTSLLLPLWRDLAQELQLPLRLVLAVRHPQEVVQSLLQRDRQAAAMTAERALRLWTRHNLQALADSQGLPLHVVSYERWFTQPELQLTALARFCGHSPGAPADCNSTLRRIQAAHRHNQRHQTSQASLPAATVRLWHQLNRLVEISLHPHPWWPAARALSQSPFQAIDLVEHWWNHGFSPEQQLQLIQRAAPPEPLPEPGGWPKPLRLQLVGTGLDSWPVHALVDRLGFHPDHFNQDPQAPLLVLHLAALMQPNQWQDLARLRAAQWVITPSEERAALLRSLGLRAHAMPSTGPNPPTWLQIPNLEQAAASELGLPPPSSLAGLAPLLCFGQSRMPSWAAADEHGLWHLPSPQGLIAGSKPRARMMAAWLMACARAGLQLVQLNPTEAERACSAVQLLQQGALQFDDPISPEEVKREWHWHQQGCPAIKLKPTPKPRHRQLWHHDSGRPARASVAISLYNYASEITRALNSVAAQSLKALDLIVVDDGSSDNSAKTALRWMETHGSQFCRCLLLQHHRNAGLASARNTAFRLARTDWVFVLDADNSLHPQALAHCLAIAEACASGTAVVHPVLKGSHAGGNGTHQLLGQLPWSHNLLKGGNYIDAMALVQRQAWATVGGYQHIPGGWEDYDFWCLLIEAGFQGVICPQPLAEYHQHEGSMLQQQSNHQLRHLSRLMQARHPWLELPFAKPDR